MLDDLTAEGNDRTMHSVAHGVVHLEELSPDYGAERRRLKIIKYRGQRYRGGYHDFIIESGGVRVFPRLVSAEHRRDFPRTVIEGKSAELNKLLGGGVERGSSVLIMGPPGTGKSLLSLTFIAGAAARGERAAMFVFDEDLGLLIERAKGLGIDLQALVDTGALMIEQVDAAELTPGEFSARVRRCVEAEGAQTVVIDSMNGYQAAMPGERALILHMHELLQYLNRQGASTFVTVAQQGLVGDMKSPVDVTYLADTVILLRYFEAVGRVRRAISDHQEAHERARGYDPRVCDRRPRAHRRRTADQLPRGPARGAYSGGAGRRPPGRFVDLIPHTSERVLILAPQGRDAEIAGAILAEAGFIPAPCRNLDHLVAEVAIGAGFSILAEEALRTADLSALSTWLKHQEEWSDFPFILLTLRGGGLERNPAGAAPPATPWATSPSWSGPSIPRPWSASRGRRSAAAGASMRRGRVCWSCTTSPPSWNTAWRCGPPSGRRRSNASMRRRSWRRWASSRAASPTTSTTC